MPAPQIPEPQTPERSARRPSRRSFPLAAMSRSIAIVTIVLLALPVGFLLPGLPSCTAVGGSLALMYAGVWLLVRPSHFAVTDSELSICFPWRRRALDRRGITRARVLSAAELRSELGVAVRIGVGGLFGGFGWLWSRRRGLVELYISRTDGLVLVERAHARALLLTPADPDAFVTAVAPLGPAPATSAGA